MPDVNLLLLVSLFVILICLIIISVIVIQKRKIEIDLVSAKAEVEKLRKYQSVADADAEAERIIEEAYSDAQVLLDEAKAAQQKIFNDAEQAKSAAEEQVNQLMTEAKQSLSEARQKAKEMRERGQVSLDEAAEQAEKIIIDAKDYAKEIAGDALLAKGKADQYENAARAMKNVIDGYGDEYIIPSRNILDDLAEDFGHKEAGQALKKAREHSKAMVKTGLAATCEYVEMNRKTFAIHFVLDAFNGKVDSALSQVRHNNYGKLRQEIIDAFNLVNYNGKAFRDARIRQQYFESRLEELKWAVAVVQLQKQAQEEQRQIREAMREEEKARREYEKVIREAEKEELTLQKAMEKVRKQMEAASEEQRLQLQQQIDELQQKLVEAEERNQRAISMAQQTRRGHVYIISNIGSFGENVYKIGLTRRLEPLDRVKELGDASVPFPFDVHAMIYSEDSPSLENQIHKVFQESQVNKVNPRKEFFNVQLLDIKKVVNELGIDAQWTMVAEAQEYKESRAIEARMLAGRNTEKALAGASLT